MKIIFYTFVVLHQIRQHALDILLLGTNTSEWWKVWVTMPQVSAPSLPNTLQCREIQFPNTLQQTNTPQIQYSSRQPCLGQRVCICPKYCIVFLAVSRLFPSPQAVYSGVPNLHLGLSSATYMSSPLECYPRTTLENLFHLPTIQYFVLFFFFRSPRI